MSLFPDNCGWCGHRWPHPHPCPGTITVRRGRPPVEGTIPCPCQRASKRQQVDEGAEDSVDARAVIGCKVAAPEARQRIEGLTRSTTAKES